MKPLFKKNRIKLLNLILLICTYGSINQVYAQCSSTVALTVPDNYLGTGLVGNGNFNAIIFGNLDGLTGDTEGRLAVGGDFKATIGYSVGYGSIGPAAPDNDDNFIVNGVFNSGTNFGVIGNFIYNTVSPGSAYPTHPAGRGSNSGPIADRLAFSTLKTAYTNLSTGLASLTEN